MNEPNTRQFSGFEANTGHASLSIITIACPLCAHLNMAVAQTWEALRRIGNQGHCIACGKGLVLDIEPLPHLDELQIAVIEVVKNAGAVISKADVSQKVGVSDTTLGRWNEKMSHYGISTTPRGYVYESSLDKSLEESR